MAEYIPDTESSDVAAIAAALQIAMRTSPVDYDTLLSNFLGAYKTTGL
jgi:hypothetical protein